MLVQRCSAMVFVGAFLLFLVPYVSAECLKNAHSWQKLPVNGDYTPEARYDHLLFVNHASEESEFHVCIYGGLGRNGTQQVVLDDVSCYDTSKSSWQVKTASGNVPAPRSNSGLITIGSYDAYVFGGLSVDNELLNDTWEFQSLGPDASWGRIRSRAFNHSMVLARYGHSATFAQVDVSSSGAKVPVMMVFGGRTDQGVSNSLQMFVFYDRVWYPLDLTLVDGIVPPPRMWHTSVWDESSSSLFIFGGTNDDGPLSDLWQYTFIGKSKGASRVGEWNLLKTSGRSPSARSGHVAHMLSCRNMLIFGGETASENGNNELFLYDIEDKKWRPVGASDVEMPKPVLGHRSFFEHSSQQVFLFGGLSGWKDGSVLYHDLWLLSTQAMCECPVNDHKGLSKGAIEFLVALGVFTAAMVVIWVFWNRRPRKRFEDAAGPGFILVEDPAEPRSVPTDGNLQLA